MGSVVGGPPHSDDPLQGATDEAIIEAMATDDERFAQAIEVLRGDVPSERELGRPFVELFPVEGTSISTIGDLLGSETVYAGDPQAARLDELQFDLGIGPCWDALSTARPVIEPDLRDRPQTVWPVFSEAAGADGVGSLFAFPMLVGSLRIGAVDMYARQPMTLDRVQTRQAASLADLVGRQVLRRALVQAAIDGPEEPAGLFSRRLIHQASGMVLAQLGISADDARLVIQGHAFSTGRSMMQVSRDVVDGVLDFSTDEQGIAQDRGRTDEQGGRRTMTESTREIELLRAFAGLADTLVAGYDVVDLMQRLVDTCRDLLEVTASGVLLADETGELDLMASTSEASRLVELFQLSAYSGPCIKSYTTGQVVAVPDIEAVPERWAQFRDRATAQGFSSIVAIPLRLRDQTIGTLNLLHETRGLLPENDLVAAQAFADVATIGILHQRTLHESDTIREQLQSALNSRIVIEQAKGVVAQLLKVSIDEAFTIIRDHARRTQQGLTTVATAIVERRLIPERD